MTYGLPSNNNFFGQMAGQPQQLPPEGFLGMGNSGMGLANAPMPQQQAAATPAQQPQLPPMNGLADILNQYVQNKTQQAGSNGTVQSILAQRFQPTDEDTNKSILQTAQSYGSDNFKPTTPEQAAQTRVGNELAPYTTALGLQGQQADVTLKQAQANQANALSQFFTGGAGFGSGGQSNGATPMNGQPQFNPRGAMLAKAMGLPEGMQIGSGGQPEQIPGMITPGQKEQDTNFAQAWQTYSNTGGAERTQNAIATVDDIINQLKSGKIQTGGVGGAFALEGGEPSWIGKAMNSPVLVARTRISNAILPQAKALFGARVTNFDAQSLINSQGLDPMAPTDTNIQKLEMLKSSLLSGQKDLQNSGQYFQQHGTLSGYQPQIQSMTAPYSVPQPIMNGIVNSAAGKAMGASVNPPPATTFNPQMTATHRYNPATGQLEAIQ